jgi:hypothetical protein
MTIPDDWKKTVRRNKLLGMWAAEKLGITGRDAEAYSDALAVGTLDPERSDVSFLGQSMPAAPLPFLPATIKGPLFDGGAPAAS